MAWGAAIEVRTCNGRRAGFASTASACFRLDLRGAGAGVSLARLPYHSGRSDDVRAALEGIARLCPSSPTTLVGFSLGGNVIA